LHVAVSEILGRLIGALPAALQAGDGRGFGLTIAGLQLSLEVSPVGKLVTAGPAPGRASKFDLGNFQGGAVWQAVQVSNLQDRVKPEAGVLRPVIALDGIECMTRGYPPEVVSRIHRELWWCSGSMLRREA
jgi:hypothetical protein